MGPLRTTGSMARRSSRPDSVICVQHHAAVVPVAVLPDELETLEPRQKARDIGLGGDHAIADGRAGKSVRVRRRAGCAERCIGSR